MLIPQGMAYALIAGLPPIYGLYASLVPLIVYAALGTSRQLAVGPVAMVSLLVAAGVAPLANGDPSRTIELAILLALLVGAIQVGLGLMRFGFVVSLLSHPVLAGFTSAAALIIGFSQLKHLLGVSLPRSHSILETSSHALAAFGDWNWAAITVGVLSAAVLLGLRRSRPRWPGALVVVALSTAASAVLGLGALGLPVVGEIPGGLPAPAIPRLSLEDTSQLLPTALVIALVGFMESIAVAKVYAARNRYAIDPNRELIALGGANLLGSFFQAYPTTGGFSRTAVNAQAGARTTASSLVSVGVIAVTLLFLTSLFGPLPNAVLAAIVIVAVSGLFDWKEARRLWSVNRRDLVTMVATFAATLGLGIELGILVGAAISITQVIQQSATPHTAVLGRLPGTDEFRNVDRYPEARRPEGVMVLRMDASLYFANADFMMERVLRAVEEEPDVHDLVLDFYPVNRVDSTGADALSRLLEELTDRGVSVQFSGLKGPVRDQLQRAGVMDQIGERCCHMNVADAVAAAGATHSERTALRSSASTSRRSHTSSQSGSTVGSTTR